MFESGKYDLITRQYGKKLVESVPHFSDPGGTIRRKVCRTRFFSVLLAPDGTVVADDGAVPDACVKHTYAAFTNLPPGLEKLPAWLKYGLYARAYTALAPYARSTDPHVKKIYVEGMKRITAYRDAVIKDVRSLEAEKNIAEAYRLASRALASWQGIRDDFTDRLRAVVSRHGGTRAVAGLLQLRRVFLTACTYLQQGRKEHAKAYFTGIVKKAPGSYYGKKAAAILRAYF